jgi:low temperature requirement protein LtrA
VVPVAASLLRRRGGGGDGGRVGMVELFFDLVFVFAVTQLSHTLLAQLDLRNALQVAMMLLAAWWAWIDTCWVTNWLDPERAASRAMLFALMGAGLVLSAAIPQAFATRGAVFATAYVLMQVGRTMFFLWALRGESDERVRNFQRIFAWKLFAAGFWIVGGLAEPSHRLAWWSVALAIETVAPALYFGVPGLGRSRIADWDVDGGHMAERCALFVIIALGESLLVTGATFAGAPWSAPTVGAFVSAFVASVAMWWLYFDKALGWGHHHIAQAADPGRLARLAYTYLHLPIVAGIIVTAVADELVLAHPDHASNSGIVAIIGGPALFLVGLGLFKWSARARRAPPLSHLVGLALLALLAVPAGLHLLTALGAGAATSAILVVVATWEHVSLRQVAHHPA